MRERERLRAYKGAYGGESFWRKPKNEMTCQAGRQPSPTVVVELLGSVWQLVNPNTFFPSLSS